MKIFFTACCLLIGISITSAQTPVYVHIYFDAVERAAEAGKRGFKQMSASTPSHLFSKRKPLLIETYDTGGKLISRVEHPYPKYKDYLVETYTYDAQKRLTRISNISSLSQSDTEVTTAIYKADGTLSCLSHQYSINSHSERPDSLFFVMSGEQINYTYRNNKDDTTFYYYDRSGFFGSREHHLIQDSTKISLNEQGCIVRYNIGTDIRYMFTRDAQCRILSKQEELLIDQKWTAVYRSSCRYDDNNHLVEYQSYSCGKELQDRCTGVLKQNVHTKYEYDGSGLVKKGTDYNKRGKKIKTREYRYSYYNLP